MRTTEKRVGHTRPIPGFPDYEVDRAGSDGPAQQANARLIAAAPAQHAVLLDALAWYMAHVYDGAPDAQNPDWVDDAREALADALVGDKDARTRWEAVERALVEWGAE